MSLIVLTLAAVLVQSSERPDASACPMHEQHMKQQAAARAAEPDSHHAQLVARGAQAMGFDQLRTSHHFRLPAAASRRTPTTPPTWSRSSRSRRSSG